MKVIEDAKAAMHRLKALIRHHEMKACYQIADDVIDWLTSIEHEFDHLALSEDLASRMFLDLEEKVEAREMLSEKIGEEAMLELSDDECLKLTGKAISENKALPKADPTELAAKGIKIIDPNDIEALDHEVELLAEAENKKALEADVEKLIDSDPKPEPAKDTE